ncbi:competence type IV pilus minor pilin ComGF [Planococcus sp. ISL-110]|uniref:competence type IV pilus minor pilin ComGF n=1 Tax=Planococcus sp. ISL-110 TaxID=2819167 RepID=UPI001BE5C923|nr:competence type IV pilus minor pilin ComGF [Planococcus sp. ISL-110]MBT2571625.1 ComGF family competence protein [Planococcus sp. ISL-110]
MRRIARLDEKGFSFLTSIFDLLVLMTMLPLIVLFFGFAVGFTEDLDAHQAEWQLFAVDLQSYLNNSESLEIINGGSGIRVVQLGEEFDIELYTDMIRKQKERKGHEVMLTRVRLCSFSLDGNMLKVRTEFTTGSLEEAEYVFTQP